jgi:putative NADH-flavin reductase
MIEKVQQPIQSDRRMTIAELEQDVCISHGSIHAILSDDLKMRHVNVKFVLRQLTMDHMECHMISEKNMQDPTFLKKIITGDESLVFAYDSEAKIEDAVIRVAHSVASLTKEITPCKTQGKSDTHCIL